MLEVSIARGRRTINRSDLSEHLTHLTKAKFDNSGNQTKSAMEVLVKIIREKKLIGNSFENEVSCNSKVICFQDVPLYNIAQNAYFESYMNKIMEKKLARYSANGIMFSKSMIWRNGGRPVLYEDAKIATEKLWHGQKDKWWRIVHTDLSNPDKCIDWTYEREWRVKNDVLSFYLNEIYVIVENEDNYHFLIQHLNNEQLKELKGIIVLDPVLR